MLATDVKPAVGVRRITDDLADAVAVFFRRVWSDTANGDSVRRAVAEGTRANPIAPGTEIPAVVFVREDEVLGHLGTVPVKFWNGNKETVAHWLKGFMVLPEHQNGPVGFAMLKELLRHVDVAATMPVALPARRLFQAVGFVDCGAVPNFVCLLRPGKVAGSVQIDQLGLDVPSWLKRSARAAQSLGIAAVAGAAAGALLGTWRNAKGSSRGFSVDWSAELPSRQELDDLWNRARSTIGAGAVRNGSFLTWRYRARAGALYEAVSVRDARRRLCAVAIVRRSTHSADPRLQGIKVATLSDIIFPAEEPLAAMVALRGAERVAHRMGADALLCSAAHPTLISLLRRRAYVRFPGNVHLMVRDPAKKAAMPVDVGGWWITRGDGNSDEGL